MPKRSKPTPPPETPPEAQATHLIDPNAGQSTQRLPVSGAGPSETTRILDPHAGDVTLSGQPEAPDVPKGAMTQPYDPQTVLASQAPPPSPYVVPDPPRRWGGWVALGACLLLGGGALWYLGRASKGTDAAAQTPAPTAGTAAQAPPPVPVALRDTVDRANGGDIAAMRVLGAMYYYGLVVSKDRVEGLRWYRRAADAGSPMAQQEFAQLQAEVNLGAPIAKP